MTDTDRGPKLAREVNASDDWRKTHPPVRMPSWWSPDTRFAWRVVADDGSVLTTGFESRETASSERLAPGERVQRVTVDLETGEEIAV